MRSTCAYRTRSRTLHLLGVAIANVLTACGLSAADLRITEFLLGPEGARYRYTPSSDAYYRLLRGDDVRAITRPVDVRLGTQRNALSGEGELVDLTPPSDAAFYRIEALPLRTSRDSDGDGLPDVFELQHSQVLNPLKTDTNGNGIPDGAEDIDHDGLTNAFEAAAGTDPTLADSDLNGVSDADEDPDLDGVINRDEALAGTDPGRPDTDGDGWNDEEGRLGGDPLNPHVVPFGIVTSTPSVEVLTPALSRTAENEAFEILAPGTPTVEVVTPAREQDEAGLTQGITTGQPSVAVRPPSLGVDLAVTATVSPTWVFEGEPVVLTAAVENHGEVPATGVVLRFPLPAGATVAQLTTSAGSCAVENGAVVCRVALIPFIGFSVQATLGTDSVLAGDADGVSNYAWDFNVAANEPDGFPADNQAQPTTLFQARLDFGDAPEPLYPTTRGLNGARHRYTLFGPRFGSGLALAINPDDELDGPASDHAEGDDVTGADDEGGVRFLTPLVPGQAAQVEIQVPTGTTGRVDAWVDFERDGWSTADRIMTAESVTGGAPFTKTFTVPSTAVPGQTFARFRISTTGVASFTGYARDGEVEDVWLEIQGCNCPKSGERIGSNPLIDSWYTEHAGELARIRETHGATPVTSWLNRVDGVDEAYADIQKVASYGGNVYVQTFGLASHIMGPWYFDQADTELFPNKPDDRPLVYQIPETPGPDPVTHRNTPMGIIGLWVNGTAIYNTTDGFSWNGKLSNPVAHVTGMDDTKKGNNLWHRSAWFAESVTFDYTLFHSPSNGEHHSHVHPAAMRLQLKDNVYASINLATGETEAIHEFDRFLHHSPILGWAADGFPIYGPYGFSDPHNADSGVRRMVSGYVLRDGRSGTLDLRVTGRKSLPVWAYRWNPKAPVTLLSDQWGPETTRPGDEDPSVRDPLPFVLGRYLEDYEYLGDLPVGIAKPRWDLDQFNGRCCVTPEFPNGTYAYFVTIDEAGVPAFPYILGPQYCGKVQGGVVGAIPANPEVEVHFEHKLAP